MPGFTPPPPYTMEDNPDSLLDRSDLVFINPVGTGYSAAIAPYKNRDFWGVDQDARSIKQFIKRYLTDVQSLELAEIPVRRILRHRAHCVLAWHAARGRDRSERHHAAIERARLSREFSNASGLMPTFAADAWYHKKIGHRPAAGRPAGLLER